jgi:hypothetical protein
MMIRVVCPNCGSKLNAKEELAGQMRKCPQCAQPVLIAADLAGKAVAAADYEAAPAEDVVRAAEQGLPSRRGLERLNRQNHYFICDRAHVLATWTNNGKGWMLRTGTATVSAKRNLDKLPNQGAFHLVELKFAATPEGKRLSGIACYQFASQGAAALAGLEQGDDLILEKLGGPSGLNSDQKAAVRRVLKEQFMRPVWENAAAVLDYLANTDHHSPGVG